MKHLINRLFIAIIRAIFCLCIFIPIVIICIPILPLAAFITAFIDEDEL